MSTDQRSTNVFSIKIQKVIVFSFVGLEFSVAHSSLHYKAKAARDRLKMNEHACILTKPHRNRQRAENGL